MTTMKTSIKATLIATAIAMLPLGSHAAGLGAIHVFSGIGQPLRAEVELSATSEELQSLSARVAPPEAFKQASLQYTSAMTALRLAVERRGNGAVVRITSDRPFNEPFVDLLIELNWAAGRLVREYTFLLDPVPVSTPAPMATRGAAPVSSPVAAPASVPSREMAAVASPAPVDRYRIQTGDTLRRIADANRPDGASLDQMLIALFRENPAAFDGDNINRLRAGAILDMPAEPTVRSIDPAQARREVQAQSADFDAYRRKLAGTVASRPAVTVPAPARGDAGAIVPKVSEPVPAGSGDKVRVSGAPADPADSKNSDNGRLARLQALEEELSARDKALEEANSRLAALETSIRQMQQLLELRNENLAQLQQQATTTTGAAVPSAATPAAPAVSSVETPVAATPAPAPVPEKAASAPAAEKAAPESAKPVRTPAVSPEEAPAPTFLQSLLDDPAMLAGGGGILALLLAYAGLKVRQRRQQEHGTQGINARASEFPPETNSVFGATGGQSVNTGESSVLHTDFSQSGLSAIDTDEGVDPVAEADVYMAYGRDAQAEEILLDALKTDMARTAIYLKLLEIYAQRKSLKPFETTATDLYSRTGGEGPDWEKAAEMGRRIDPDNPLYGTSAGAARGSMEGVTQASAAAVGVAVAGGAIGEAAAAGQSGDASLSDLDFVTSFAAEGVDLPPEVPDFEAVASDEGGEPAPAIDVELEALPEVDSEALDFDLDVGLDLGDVAPNVGASEIELSAAVAGESAAGLDLDIGEIATEPEMAETSPLPEIADSMGATVVGDGLDFAAADQTLEFELAPEEVAPDVAGSAGVDLNATVVGTEASTNVTESDLEKTTFDSSLLDFDFNLEDTGAQEPSLPAGPALDLSSIDLNLEGTMLEADSTQSEASESSTIDDFELAVPEIATSEEDIPGTDMLEEVNTKLELARAYEEMGDAEGARELIEEVLREGSAEQREAAARLMERLG
jgi:pilus assembly protein FimV